MFSKPAVLFVLATALSAGALRAGETTFRPSPSLAALLREEHEGPVERHSHLQPVSTLRAAATIQPAAALDGPEPAVAAQSLVRAWGYNGSGQLGNGTTTTSTSPVTVSPNGTFTGTNITALAAGAAHSLALQGGTVYAWGFNGFGQLGNNSTTNSSVPVPVSSANGFTNTNVTAVAAGAWHSLAVQDGAAYTWGYNAAGQLGNNSTTNSSVPVAVSGLTSGVTAVAGGTLFSLAIQNGAVYAWGYNAAGQLGNNSMTDSHVPVGVSGLTSGVTAVAAGELHSLAIKNGAAYAWGNNGYGQLGNNSTTQSNVPVAVLGLSTGVTAIAAGAEHSLAVQNGNVFAWGDNNDGQLGNGTTTNSSAPVEIKYGGSFLSNIVTVAAGKYSSYALSGDGSLYVWGDNTYGELGLGTTTTDYTAPQHLTPPTGQYYQLIDGDADEDSGGYGDHAVALLGSTAPVPEPSTWLGGALLLGASGVALRRRVRQA